MVPCSCASSGETRPSFSITTFSSCTYPTSSKSSAVFPCLIHIFPLADFLLPCLLPHSLFFHRRSLSLANVRFHSVEQLKLKPAESWPVQQRTAGKHTLVDPVTRLYMEVQLPLRSRRQPYVLAWWITCEVIKLFESGECTILNWVLS